MKRWYRLRTNGSSHNLGNFTPLEYGSWQRWQTCADKERDYVARRQKKSINFVKLKLQIKSHYSSTDPRTFHKLPRHIQGPDVSLPLVLMSVPRAYPPYHSLIILSQHLFSLFFYICPYLSLLIGRKSTSKYDTCGSYLELLSVTYIEHIDIGFSYDI